MALPVLDGNQSATTLSSVVTGGEHIVAHTVVSLGSTAISNITSAVSGIPVSGTVTANVTVIDNINNTPISPKATDDGFLISVIEQMPPISGTVTANVANIPYVKITDDANNVAAVDEANSGLFVSVAGSVTIPISGTVTANLGNPSDIVGGGYNNFEEFAASGGIPVNLNNNFVNNTLPISGAVTANLFAYDLANDEARKLQIADTGVGLIVAGSTSPNDYPVQVSGTVTVGAMPNGALTTRFGTPTTANTAFATSAVTNTSRKYLLIQNVTTGGNVITVGIGFTPTTTQGIQLTAGAGITFESSYIPTGAVRILSSVTASSFTILEA